MIAKNIIRPQIWMYGLQRLATWYPLRKVITKIVVFAKPKYIQKFTESNIFSQELERDGITLLNQFVSADAITRIKEHLVGLPLKERFDLQRSGFYIDNVPENVHVAEYFTKDIVSSVDVIALANNPQILDIAGKYLGCKPTISNISIWWSIPADGSAQEAENYHRDVDDFKFVKFFVYLSDVDAGNGPHCFVKGSHRDQRFLKIRRILDDEVYSSFPHENILSLSGKTGDAFLEDTFGLHKGQPPRNGRRLLLQVEYSVGPIAVYDYSVKNRNINKGQFDSYVNRLYIR
ncbi:phytanoyl-CoA dioxygenase family protein [Undibacterium crateris]|uniref:phytanoyl-CoA dioxygenase family protein n=1 Tax=Undibacterium crateris TaxID=2528175 RepID=UPI001389C53D|nr:phytanoyl-CoA dioxygenase family protein [Undibacterium crateris]NDI84633.1 hypothetical protein [Undibacterium crateris]